MGVLGAGGKDQRIGRGNFQLVQSDIHLEHFYVNIAPALAQARLPSQQQHPKDVLH